MNDVDVEADVQGANAGVILSIGIVRSNDIPNAPLVSQDAVPGDALWLPPTPANDPGSIPPDIESLIALPSQRLRIRYQIRQCSLTFGIVHWASQHKGQAG